MDQDLVKKNNDVLDFVMHKVGAKIDAELSRALSVQPPIISRIRHGNLGLSPLMLIKIHELTEISFKELRAMLSTEKPATIA